MNEIPKDLLTKAEDTLDNCLCHDPEAYNGSYEDSRKAAIEDIAKVLLSERIKCAMIARNWKPSSNKDEHYAANTIADQIMGISA